MTTSYGYANTEIRLLHTSILPHTAVRCNRALSLHTLQHTTTHALQRTPNVYLCIRIQGGADA